MDVITSGNHIWDKREIYQYLETSECALRPHNYGTPRRPGARLGDFDALDGSHVAVMNLQGRTYMQPIENPFTDADICSMNRRRRASAADPPRRLPCELTSEKNALGLYLEWRVSAVVGTHTHVVTGDERILPGGTAYQTDLGMTGPVWSVIGFDPATVLPRFINALPTRFEVGDGAVVFNAAQIDIDAATGRALSIERIQQLVELSGPATMSDRPAVRRSRRYARLGGWRGRPAESFDGRPPHPLHAFRRRAAADRLSGRAAAGVRIASLTDHDTLGRLPGVVVSGR